MRSVYKFWLVRFVLGLMFSWATGSAFSQTSAGPNAPSSNGAYYTDWTNPTNAYTGGNDVYATAVAKASTSPKNHDWGSFGFTIPTGSTITGIEVAVEHKVSSVTGPPACLVYVRKSSTSEWSSSYTMTMSVTESTETFGGAGQLWGKTGWTAADFSNGNIAVWLNYSVTGTTNRTISVDGITLKVYYTPPPNLGKSIDGMSSIIWVDGMTVTSGNTIDGM